jgi:hypothetical protein
MKACFVYLHLIVFAFFPMVLSAQDPQPPENRPVKIVTPRATLERTGCWVTIYDEKNYQGQQLTSLEGFDLPHLLFDDADWRGRVQSLEVGPNAEVTLYEEEFFQGRSYPVTAGGRLPGFVQLPWIDVASIQVTCIH